MKESTLIEQFIEEKKGLIEEQILKSFQCAEKDIQSMLCRYKSSAESISKEGLKFNEATLNDQLRHELKKIFTTCCTFG